MATRKPNTFPLRPTLDGTEELYTQTNGVSEKFLVSDICGFCTGESLPITVKGGGGIGVEVSGETAVTGATVTVRVKTSPSGGIRISPTGDSLEITPDGVDDTMIDFGTGDTQVNAKDIPICDIADKFTGLTIEDALVELDNKIVAESQDLDDVMGIGSVASVATDVEITSIVSGVTSTLQLNDTEVLLRTLDSSFFGGELQMSPAILQLEHKNASGGFSITINSTAGTVTDAINSRGLVYDDFYEANFIDKSLVSKKYVDNEISTLTGETLGETLVIGNTTDGNDIIMSSGDVLIPSIGSGGLDLRNADITDNIVLANDFSGSKGYLILNPTTSQFGFGAGSGLYLEASATEMFFRTTALTSYMAFNSGNGGYRDISLFGTGEYSLVVTDNELSDRTSNTIPFNALFLNSNATFLSGVTNSVATGGDGLTISKDNSVYMNQAAFQLSGATFDICIVPTGATADRVQTLQDKDGDIALVSDITDKEYIEIVTLASGTPMTITHSLGTTNIMVQLWAADGTIPDVTITKTGINAIDLESALGETDLEVLVLAFG